MVQHSVRRTDDRADAVTLPAGAALGTTTDPKALIKGEPSKVQSDSKLLSDESTRVSGLADDIDAIAVAGWSGGFGRPAYDAARSAEQDKWTSYAEMLTAASKSLSTYASALTTAQSRAADAIAKWQQGEDATKQAVSDYNAAVDSYNSYVNRQVCVPSYGGGSVPPSIGPSRPGPFHDPGQTLRDEAEQILEDARTALESAGAAALQELGGLPGAKTESSSGAAASGSAEGPSIDWGDWSDTFGKDPLKGKDGKYDDGQKDSPFTINLGKVEGEARLFGAEGSIEDYWGDVKVNADGTFTFLGADASASAKIDANGLVGQAHAGVTIVGVKGSAGAEYGITEVEVKGEASAGANADGEVAIGPQGVHAGGEVFAGAKAEASASGDVGGVGGEVGAEGWAGIGASGDVDFGFHDGKFEIGGSGGIALGVGGKLSAHITIDPGEVMETTGDIIEGIGEFLS